MRFTLSSTALSSKLSALSKVINSKNALPILGDFVFEVKDNVLYLTASDSENVMKTQLELTESDGNCRFAIGNHDLLEAVKGFSEQPITFDVDQFDGGAHRVLPVRGCQRQGLTVDLKQEVTQDGQRVFAVNHS